MASVWKRLQRVNKRAAKFQYTASYHRIDLETTAKWKPSKLSIVWTRRSRRVATEPLDWEPTLKDPLKGSVNYPVAENHSVAVTLFKDSRTNELEDKDWTFVLEDVSSNGKRRRIAQANINMRLYASLQPSQRSITVPLQPTSKVKAASIALTLHCVLLREGSATDEDMQSLASLLSVNNNSDIAVLEDLDGDITLSDDSSRQVLDLCQQMEQLTRSLSETPDSVRSLPTDTRTPTAPASPDTPLGDDIKTPQNSYPVRTDKDIFDPTEPKFSYSPPKFSIPSQLDNKLNKLETKTDTQPYKGPIFKTKSVTKINLKPLDLKTNLNLSLEKERELKTPEEETMQEKMDRVKTPVQDLLEWCQSVTEDYRQAKITDLTSSFRSGIAFCAIIHHFRPELIDFGGLDPTDQVSTLRTAFSASAVLGLPPLLCVADMTKATLDRLQIMTYLFQLRAHFTGSELEVEQLGNSESESTYLVGRHDTDERLPPALFSREIVTRRSRNMLKPHIKPQVLQEFESSTPDSAKDVRDANNVFKTLSPVKDNKSSERTTNWYTDPLRVDDEESRAPTRLMSRRELSDPFDFTHDSADTPTEPSPDQKTPTERDEKSPVSLTQQAVVSPTTDLPKPTPQLLSRHDELKEKARQLLEATKREARSKRQSSKETEDEMANGNGVAISPIMEDTNSVPAASPQGTTVGTPGTIGETAEARQARLRERARRLIADARAGLLSPTSPNRGRGTMEIINQQTVLEEVANNGGDIEALLGRSESIHSSPSRRSHSLSPDRSEGRNSSESRSEKSPEHRAATDLSGLAELAGLKGISLSPEHDRAQAGGIRYIESEQLALEREQAAVDSTAAKLEARLRHAMDSHDTQEEDRLLSQWFHLVNKKNALLRRQMQLNILEREDDLSARCSLLGRQLRQSLALDDWRKTPAQRDRERLLLQELVEAVNERDRLVQEMDEQEKAIADDNEIERNLSQVDLQRKNNCVIQ